MLLQSENLHHRAESPMLSPDPQRTEPQSVQHRLISDVLPIPPKFWVPWRMLTQTTQSSSCAALPHTGIRHIVTGRQRPWMRLHSSSSIASRHQALVQIRQVCPMMRNISLPDRRSSHVSVRRHERTSARSCQHRRTRFVEWMFCSQATRCSEARATTQTTGCVIPMSSPMARHTILVTSSKRNCGRVILRTGMIFWKVFLDARMLLGINLNAC